MDLSVSDPRQAAASADERIREDVTDILTGLAAEQKTLPSRLFYDEAGCALFGAITALPEYYVTRCEMALLAAHAGEIVGRAPAGSVLVEYGASDEAKAALLLRASEGRLSGYVPIDIAGPALASLRARMLQSHPGLSVQPVEADFTAPVRLPDASGGRTLGCFPGGTSGIFDPPLGGRCRRPARADLSRGGREDVQFVVGTDLRKDPAVLIPAYDDAAGVTAAFNRNILRHVNRIADANFDAALFAHSARWNGEDGRIEMHLVSRLPQVVQVAGRPIPFTAGESIHTESSYKHTEEGFLALARAAGWSADGFWADPQGRFGTHRLVTPGRRHAPPRPAAPARGAGRPEASPRATSASSA